MICGVVTWSLLEYAIHRFIFHWLSEQKLFNYSIGSFHLYHHEIPSDRRVYTSGLVPALFWSAFTFSSMTILSVNSNIVLVTLITGTLFYFFYEWVHFYVHVREFHFAPIRYLQMLHLHHHLRDGKNFGQTLPLWDVIFRTYETPDEKRVLKELSELLMSGNER
jgi:sterol desaturase/sphingolipid hydroxylase (fatty acid hydroxylase superfamily)